VRVAYLISKWNQALLLNDSLYYSIQAQQLTRGELFRELFVDEPGAEHGPLTPIVLAPVSWMGNPVPWQRSVMTLFGLATVILLGRIGWRLGGRRVAQVATAIAALYPNLWLGDALVMSESVALVFVCLTLVVALSPPAESWQRLALIGVLVALAALARSEIALLTPGLMVMAWRGWFGALSMHRVGRAAVVGAAALVTVSPWVGANLVRFDEPVLMTTNEGGVLYGANCPVTYSGPLTGTWTLLCYDEALVPEDADPSERNALQRRAGLSYMRNNLERLPIVVVARLARTFDLWGFESLVAFDVGEERPRAGVWAGIVAFWMLLPLAALGIRRVTRRVRWILLLPWVAVIVTTIVFYGAHRIRSTAEPSLVLLAALTVGGWFGDRDRSSDDAAEVRQVSAFAGVPSP
jgi:4-amino-4-deoxy-L-arabinose transferase-like glycosyltransferase